MFAAARYDSMVQARKELYARLAAGEDRETILKDLERRDQVYLEIYTDSLLPFSPAKENFVFYFLVLYKHSVYLLRLNLRFIS